MKDKDLIMERLDSLRELVSQTQPEHLMYDDKDKMDGRALFQSDMIQVEEMIENLQMNEVVSMSELMRRANSIWVFRNKVKNGEIDLTHFSEQHSLMNAEMKIMVKKGRKIEAIKFYRRMMKDIFNKEKSLKESKEMVDHIANGGELKWED